MYTAMTWQQCKKCDRGGGEGGESARVWGSDGDKCHTLPSGIHIGESAGNDLTQYRDMRLTSIAHFVVGMLHRILVETYKNFYGENKAILCTFIQWKQAVWCLKTITYYSMSRETGATKEQGNTFIGLALLVKQTLT